MNLYEYIKEQLGDRHFETIAEYNDCVRGISADIEEELGRAERYYTGDRGWKDTDVVIKEVLDQEERDEELEELDYHEEFGDRREDGSLKPLYKIYYKRESFGSSIYCPCENDDEARAMFRKHQQTDLKTILKGAVITKIKLVER